MGGQVPPAPEPKTEKPSPPEEQKDEEMKEEAKKVIKQMKKGEMHFSESYGRSFEETVVLIWFLSADFLLTM